MRTARRIAADLEAAARRQARRQARADRAGRRALIAAGQAHTASGAYAAAAQRLAKRAARAAEAARAAATWYTLAGGDRQAADWTKTAEAWQADADRLAAVR
jgi:hypothetical protein